MAEQERSTPQQVGLKVKVLYYPFMGTEINTERLLLLARLCYSPMGIGRMGDLLTGNKPSDGKAGEFVRNLIEMGHMGALEHWYTTFAVEGYSRISSQQNDRHRLMKMFKDAGVIYINAPEQGRPTRRSCSNLSVMSKKTTSDMLCLQFCPAPRVCREVSKASR